MEIKTLIIKVMKKIIMILLGIAMCISLIGCQNADKGEQTEDGNGIPVIYLNIDAEEFEKVNASEDHSYRAKGGSISITVPDHYMAVSSSWDERTMYWSFRTERKSTVRKWKMS